MTLFDLARKNIRKNFTDYFLYFSSMVFSIVIYFTFVSLKYNEAIVEATTLSQKISSVFNVASVVLILFVALFIWYSNAFFMRKRKKEIGLYSLLGVRKKQIGRLLFYENFLMGVIALFVGVLLGFLLSKVFAALLMKVMGYEILTGFTLSLTAVWNTMIVFLLITLITSFHGYRLIYHFKLIDLFRAEKEGEEEPRASFISAFLAVLFIGVGYWLALQNILESEAWRVLGILGTPLVIIFSVIIGTYLLFNTLTVYLLKLAKKNKKRLWKGINLVSTSQLLYRIKGNARTLTIISILCATTITAMGTAYNFYYNNKSSAELANPNSMMFINNNNAIADKVETILSEEKDHLILYHETVPTLQVKVDTWALGSKMGEETKEYTIISAATFNELAELQGREDRLFLQGNEATVLDTSYYEGLSPEYVGSSIPLNIGNSVNEIQFTQLMTYNVLNYQTVGITIVVSDDLFSNLDFSDNETNIEIYAFENEKQAASIDAQMRSLLPEEARYASFYSDYAQGMETSGLLVFIGAFLGLVFLAATGSIIHFKQLTEANADVGRYMILQKIGVNKKEIKKTVSQQVFFIFALPLFVGIVHSMVALLALAQLLQINLVIPVVICLLLYILIYAVYYIATVRSYYKIVSQ